MGRSYKTILFVINMNCRLPILKIISGITNLIMLIAISMPRTVYSSVRSIFIILFKFAQRVNLTFSPKLCILYDIIYHNMAMEEVTSNMTIAVIMVQS